MGFRLFPVQKRRFGHPKLVVFTGLVARMPPDPPGITPERGFPCRTKSSPPGGMLCPTTAPHRRIQLKRNPVNGYSPTHRWRVDSSSAGHDSSNLNHRWWRIPSEKRKKPARIGF